MSEDQEANQEQMDWGQGEINMDAVTLQDFDDLCNRLLVEREKEASKARDLKEQSNVVENVETQILAYMSHFQRPKYVLPNGAQIIISKRRMVKMPDNLEDKHLFFDYLKEINAFDALVTVNSQSLNSFVKQEYEAQEQKGNHNFKVPGLPDPVVRETLNVRKGKS